MNIIQLYLSIHIILGLILGNIYVVKHLIRGKRIRLIVLIILVIGSLPLVIAIDIYLRIKKGRKR